MSITPPSPGRHASEGGWLVAEALSLRYRDGATAVQALTTVSLELRPGAFVALRGPSGSGKTSLLHCLGGLQIPTSGQVRWSGHPLRSLDATARAAGRGTEISYVFQGGNLLDTFTAEQNLTFAMYVSGAPDPELVSELFGRFGLDGKQEALPGELSGGQQQRLALARALAQRPKVLLADEPTGHLDSASAEEVLDLIEMIHREQQMTVVLATHDQRVAERATYVHHLRDGRMEA